MSDVRSRMKVAVAVVMIGILLAGCGGRSFVLENNLVALCKQYTEDFAAKKVEQVTEVLTGEALEAWKTVAPILTAADMKTEIKSFEGKVDYVNRDKTRADVQATYVQEQTVPGFGISTMTITAVYSLKKIGDAWKIYAVRIVEKTEKN